MTSSDLATTRDAFSSNLRHFRAAGVSVVVDVSQMSAILYWGADLGDLTGDALHVLAGASRLHPRAACFDTAGTLGLLPEAATGWFGILGIIGHRGGQDWSPSFVGAGPPDVTTTGETHLVVVDASDPDLHLRVRVDLNCFRVYSCAATTLTTGGLLSIAVEHAGSGVPADAALVPARSRRTHQVGERQRRDGFGLSLDQMQGRLSVDPRWALIDAGGLFVPLDQRPAMRTLRTGRPGYDWVVGVHRPSVDATAEHVWITGSSYPILTPRTQPPFPGSSPSSRR